LVASNEVDVKGNTERAQCVDVSSPECRTVSHHKGS